MEIVFLGTSCMVPTKERAHSAIFLSYKSDGILIDCGENCQRQLKLADIAPTKVNKILISHWHGDHVLGLPGLLQTLSSSDYSGVLEIYGPKGTEERIKLALKAFVFDVRIEYKIKDLEKDGKIFENKDCVIEAYKLEHSIDCLGFKFIEKDRRKIKVSHVRKLGIPDGPLLGKLQKGQDIVWKGKKVKVEDATYIVEGRKLGFITDTVLCNNCYKIAQDTDLLICEASYASDLENKAEEYKHMTAKQAGLIASNANAKKLILTHFSQRYKDMNDIKEDAETVFNNIALAHDFMKIKL